MYGYAGKILYVNLSEGKFSVKPLPEELVRDYIGGRGFVARLVYDGVPAGADPLGPANRLVVASGPLAGTLVPGGGKAHLGAKSPATGGYGDSNVGGHLAAEMKYAGYDALVIDGSSPFPCCLVIDDNRVEILPAGELWGQGAIGAEAALKEKLGEDFQIMIIGPAGENRVKYACVNHDFGRQAGRTGMGAVLGAKGVKAVAFRGTGTIDVARPQEMEEVANMMHRQAREHPAFGEWQRYGTAGVTKWANEVGCFPTRNFSTSYFESHHRLHGEVMREKIVVGDKGCFCCIMNCGKYSRVRLGGREVYVEGPEYETTALIGGNFALESIEEVAYMNYLCDDLGLDTISFGNVAGFVAECFARGLLTARDFEGREIRFGDLEAIAYLAEIVAYRRGIGDLIAEGVLPLARKLGGEALDIAMQVKGLEVSGYESRNAAAMLLSYMTCDVGAHHNRSWAITYDLAVGRTKTEGKAERVIALQHIRPVFDMLGACRLYWVELEMNLDYYARMYSALTGRDVTWNDLLICSERVWNLTRLFWFREVPGFGRAYDLPPARVYREETPSGPSKGAKISLEEINRMLDEYYRLRGWDESGRPTPEKLRELGLA